MRSDYAQILGYLGKTIAAEEQFSQAIASSQRLISDHPNVQPYQSDQGIAYRMLADFRVEQGQLDKGLEAYSKAIQLLTTTFVQIRHATLKTALCRSHEHRADTLDQLSRHDEPLGDWDKVLELCDPDMSHVHCSQRADSLLRSGKVDQALAEVEKLAQVDTKNPTHWFRFAKLFAIASESLPARKDEHAVRAIEARSRKFAFGQLHVLPNLENCGRNGHCCPPPAQIRTCGTTAYDSSLGLRGLRCCLVYLP